MERSWITSRAVVLVIAAVVLAACSGTNAGDDEGSVPTPTSAPATATTASTEAATATTPTAPPKPTPTVISAAGGTATPGTVAGGREDYCAELAGGSTDNDVRVPAGETCTLDNARVGPNVILARDATLHARGSTIGGNVLSEGAAAVNLLDGTTVGGNIQVERSGSVQVIDARVDGNIHL